MASQEGAVLAADSIPPSATPTTAPSSKPVEMNTLHSSEPEQASQPADQAEPSHAPTQVSSEDAVPPAETAIAPSQPPSQPTHAPMTQSQTEALGPATEGPITAPTASGLALSITLQLVTGQRHPYKIDQKYLTNRKVEAKSADGSFDPREISGYKLKELIWTDWRSEWEPKPASPSSIRLIRGGKFIDDKKSLSDYNMSFEESNFIQMTVKPADFGEDDETAGGKTGKGSSIRQRDGEDAGAGCRCVIL